jgi:hypothetical protein
MTTNIKIIKVSHEVKSIIGRNLNKKNLLKMFDQYDYINFSDFYLAANPELKWKIFKDKILNLLDKIMPEETIYIKTKDFFPWIDNDLLYIKHLRDSSYKNYKKNDSINDYENYKDNLFQFSKS